MDRTIVRSVVGVLWSIDKAKVSYMHLWPTGDAVVRHISVRYARWLPTDAVPTWCAGDT